MATNRPANLELVQQGGGTSRPTLTRGGANPQMSISDGQLLSPTSTVKPVRLCVYTMNKEQICSENMKFSSGRLTTTKQVRERVLRQLKIPTVHWKAFGLWLKSKNLQLQLKGYHFPCKLFQRWKDLLSQYTSATYEEVCTEEPYLCLQRNTFLSLEEEMNIIHSTVPDKAITLNLLYHEAVRNVTQSPYPVKTEELHILAGLQAAVVRAETGQKTVLKLDNVCQYYPAYMSIDNRSLANKLFSSKPSPAFRETEQQFQQSFDREYAQCSDVDKLKVNYLTKCWQHSMYGSMLFKGQIKKVPKVVHHLYYSDRQVHVAINMGSVHILSTSSPPEVLLHEPIEKLCWQFEASNIEGEDFYSVLWLEYQVMVGQQNVFKLLQVFSRQAPMMDAMLRRCWADMEKKEPGSPSAVDGKHCLPQTCEHKLHCEEFSADGVCLKSTEGTLTKRGKKGSVPAKSEERIELETMDQPLTGRTTGV